MDSQLLSAIYKISKEATIAALAEKGLISPIINQAEAYRLFTRRLIEDLEKKGKIIGRKGKRSVTYNREEIVKAVISEGEYVKRLPLLSG